MKPCYDCGEDTNSTQRKRCLKCFAEHRRKQQKANKLKFNYHKLPKYRYNTYKSGAERRGLEFSLTFEDFILFWEKPCFYCGEKIEGIGIDRKNNSIGYTNENCIVCCKICNFMKHNLDENLFIKQCIKISDTHRRTK